MENPRGQDVGVDFEPDRERRRRVHALLDDLVHVKRVGPELLVTKRIEAEDALAVGDRIDRASPRDRRSSGRRVFRCVSTERGACRHHQQSQHSDCIDRGVSCPTSKKLDLRDHSVLAIPGAVPPVASPTRRTTPHPVQGRHGP